VEFVWKDREQQWRPSFSTVGDLGWDSGRPSAWTNLLGPQPTNYRHCATKIIFQHFFNIHRIQNISWDSIMDAIFCIVSHFKETCKKHGTLNRYKSKRNSPHIYCSHPLTNLMEESPAIFEDESYSRQAQFVD
jgi:hypothetical protein